MQYGQTGDARGEVRRRVNKEFPQRLQHYYWPNFTGEETELYRNLRSYSYSTG